MLQQVRLQIGHAADLRTIRHAGGGLDLSVLMVFR